MPLRSSIAVAPDSALETVPCPFCRSSKFSFWAAERGFNVVRCSDCDLLYVNPRPRRNEISVAVETGVHADRLNVVGRRVPKKVPLYRKLFAELFSDVWRRSKPVTWLDVGAGYGEIVEAVASLAPPGSVISGIEPMRPKAEVARSLGLNVKTGYLESSRDKVEFISLVDVFSHLEDFHGFLSTVRSRLVPSGEFFIETGNMADLQDRSEFPNVLGLPDHLAFAGEAHLRGYLDRAGFDIVAMNRARFDTALQTAKTAVKKLRGDPVLLSWPYSSDFRSLQVRARLRST